MNPAVHMVRAVGREAVSRVGTPAGALEAAAWLASRGLDGLAKRWDVSIVLPGEDVTTRLHLAIAHDEWGFFFHYGRGMSWIRVTDAPHAHEADDFGLLAQAPKLRDIGAFVQGLEERYQFGFLRSQATIRTSIGGTEPTVRIWVAATL